MYDDLHALNDNRNEHSDDDDVVNNPDDLVHSDVEEIPNVNNGSGDEAVNDGEGSETENKDEESRKVEPKRKRVSNPQPKLNDQRLKGPRGIGVIEKMFEDVKLKGKGYEKEDLDVVMGRLEHWAHRLFPKFQFDDCLHRIEKLGSKRPVSNYVKRIRLGMEEEIVNEIIEPPSPEPSVDPFDELIGRQQEPSQIAKKPATLTAEQRERMLRNRMIAEERRMARLKAQKEREAQTNKNTEEVGSIVLSQSVPGSEQMDVAVTHEDVSSEDVVEKQDNQDHTIAKSVEEINLTCDGYTEAVVHVNQETNISDTADIPLEGEEHSVDTPNVVNNGNVKGAVSDKPIITDHDNESAKIVTHTEQDMVENKQ